MKLSDAIELINNPGVSIPDSSMWADLGCGSGLFTNALAKLLSPGSKIYAVDKDVSSFKNISLPKNVSIEIINADFIRDDLPFHDLNGIMMANSLHFLRDKISLLAKLRHHMKGYGSFLIVEYDMDTPNPWVPFPLSYYSLRKLFEKLNYDSIQKLYERSSVYNRANIYSALISF